MGTGAVTRFPLLNTVLATHVESLILCAEVRAGDGGDAVIIAVAPVSRGSGVAPLPSLAVGNTGHVGHTLKDKWEAAGTAGVRSRHCVAAGVCVRHCVSPDVSHYRRQENA